MEFKYLEGGAYMMKSMDIENHGNTCIESIVGNIHVAIDKYSLFVSKHHMTQLHVIFSFGFVLERLQTPRSSINFSNFNLPKIFVMTLTS
jgi:hypothetical protein